LDDDDEYLPGAIDTRLAEFRRRPNLDVVVTNGWRKTVDGRDEVALSDLSRAAPDLMRALFRQNWLASCGGLFKSSRVDVEYFKRYHSYLEWTWLAFQLESAALDIGVLNEPTFRIFETPDSASKSPAYAEATLVLYERMLSMTARPDIRRLLEYRIQNQWHMRSTEKLRTGDVSGAWSDFRHVFRYPHAWKFATQAGRIGLYAFLRLVHGDRNDRAQ
jgi:hypothetical protein